MVTLVTRKLAANIRPHLARFDQNSVTCAWIAGDIPDQPRALSADLQTAWIGPVWESANEGIFNDRPQALFDNAIKRENSTLNVTANNFLVTSEWM